MAAGQQSPRFLPGPSIRTDGPRNAVETQNIRVHGLLSPTRNADFEKAADFNLRELNQTKDGGWELCCILPGTPVQFQNQPVEWPALVFRKKRRPGSRFI